MGSILAVDRYPPIGLLYREVLEEEGHHVLVALSGREAFELAENETIDVIIVDERVPDCGAEELLETLKLLQPQVRSILTVASDLNPIGNARLWDEVLLKTCDFTILQTKVNRLLR